MIAIKFRNILLTRRLREVMLLIKYTMKAL